MTNLFENVHRISLPEILGPQFTSHGRSSAIPPTLRLCGKPFVPRPRQHPAAPAAGSPNQKTKKLGALPVFAVKILQPKLPPSHQHPQIFTQKISKNFPKPVSEHRPLCVNNAPMWIGKEARRAC
jgi:hypothetical protein